MTVLMSGLFRIELQNGRAFHLNLTLSDYYKGLDDDVKFELLQRFFYDFRKRVERVSGERIRYCRVNTLEGNGVVHCIYEGPDLRKYFSKDEELWYLKDGDVNEWSWIQENWIEISGSSIVFFKELYGESKKQAHYIASQYISGHDKSYIYGTSRDWVYSGFLDDYNKVKRGSRNFDKGYVNDYGRYCYPVDWDECKVNWSRYLYGVFVNSEVIPQYMLRK